MESCWQLPKPHSVLEIDLDDKNRILVRQHGTPSSGRRLVLSHGNGLAIDIYYPFWSRLENEFELLIYDLRNHGWNNVSSPENHNLFSMVTDLDKVLYETEQHFGSKFTVGVYHSLSAMISLLLSSEVMTTAVSPISRGFDGLVLFDPPLHVPGSSYTEFDELTLRRARATRNRQIYFESYEQYQELLDFLPAYSKLVPGAKALIARSVLQEIAEVKGLELRCPRHFEAQIIEFVRGYTEQVDFNNLPCPTKVIGSDPLLPFSYLPTVDLSDVLSVDFDFIPDTSHFLQIEKPAECAEYVRKFVAQISECESSTRS